MAPPKREPTPDELEALRVSGDDEISRRFGPAVATIRRWRHEYGIPNPYGRRPARQPNRAPEDAYSTPDDWQQLWDNVAERVEAEDDTDEDETRLERDLGDKPVGILLWSDWHIGSRWTDYRQLDADVALVAAFQRQHPKALHLAHLGDGWDNYHVGMGKVSGGVFESAIANRGKQRELFKWKASQVSDWITLLYGCHPAWDVTNGSDPLQPIAKELGTVCGGYGVVLDARVGDQTYRLLLRHRTRRESSLNTTNAQRALDDDYGVDGRRFDAICVSHLHNNDLQVRSKAGRRVVFTRSGAYKGSDCFARSIAATHDKGADTGAPLLILLPHEHHILAFHGADMKHGLEYLADLRKRS